jgi:hypothetical protein
MGKPLKGAKNIAEVLQSYVTYDTLQQPMNLPTALFQRFAPGRHCNE